MTAAKAIGLCDELKPNSYDTVQKMRWLSELEALITDEVYLTHECELPQTLQPESGNADSELSVKHPYDKIYPAYLRMEIDRANNDAARYANSATEFSAAYSDFLSWFNRTHMPVQKNQHFRLLRRG